MRHRKNPRRPDFDQPALLTLESVTDQLQALLRSHHLDASMMPWPGPMDRVVCADQFAVSIQASEYAYCRPRNNAGPWTHVELGYPTQPMPALAEWIETGPAGTNTQTVWPYTPIEAIAQVLLDHGGLIAA